MIKYTYEKLARHINSTLHSRHHLLRSEFLLGQLGIRGISLIWHFAEWVVRTLFFL